MPNSEFALQGLTSQSTDASQSATDSVDIGAYRRLTMHVQRVSEADTGSVLILQTAPSQTDARFVDLAPPIDLSKLGDVEESFSELMRYVRWRVLIPGGTAQFAIDIVARGV